MYSPLSFRPFFLPVAPVRWIACDPLQEPGRNYADHTFS